MTASAQSPGAADEETALVGDVAGEEAGDGQQIRLSRRFYRGSAPWDDYPLLEPRPSLRQRLVGACHCSSRKAWRSALACLPVLNVLRKYKLEEYAVGDLVAGLSSAFLHLPQGLGFGLLASLQPAHGLNTTFFSILLYMLFGTSPHVSMGTSALMALLTEDVVQRQVFSRGILISQANASSSSSSSSSAPANASLGDPVAEFKTEVAMAVTLLSGLMLLAMGVLRLGYLTNYMAASFVGGFTNAAAVHIVTSQIPKMFNLRIPSFTGVGKLVRTYVAIFSSLGEVNPADAVIALVCVAILLAVKLGVNERCKERMKIPIPIDLLLVISCTFASHFGDFQARWGVAVVGTVPRGFPTPRLPDTSVLADVAGPSFAIAVLTFALTTLLANLCARLHGLRLDNDRELVAYGLTNLASAFFPCFPSCTAPPRTMLLSSLGARTTLNALPALAFMLVVLLAAGPLFQELPLAMLGAMIAVAMMDLLSQVRQLPGYWRVSKADFAIWVVTWLVAALGDLDLGLAAGVVFSLLTVVLAGQMAEGQVLGLSESESLCLPGSRRGLRSPPAARVFHFPAQLYFATAERFRHQLYAKVLDPTGPRIDLGSSSVPTSLCNDHVTATEGRTDVEGVLRYVILDCSSMTYADVAGVRVLRQVVAEYSQVDVQLLLTSCPPSLTQLLRRSEFFDSFPEELCFYSVWDAVHWLQLPRD